MTKRFIAFARVSSREQKEEGWSLEIQRDRLREYAARQQGEIIQEYMVAETASKAIERKTFKEMLGFARKNAHKLDGILVMKIDRAARNLFDYVDLERLEAEHGVKLISVTQPTENDPAGRMMRRTLANMAAFYTEQQSVDVKAGHERRVENGLFACKAPYGFRNIRADKRGLIELHPEYAPRVKRVFELYAFHNHTLDSLQDALHQEGTYYTASTPRFPRSKLYSILTDRAYIGEVFYREEWHPGQHPKLVDRALFHRVQVLLGGKTYKSHEMLFAGSLITCGHCGHPITGETKAKQTKAGVKEYVYYRCTQYNKKDHPRTRLSEENVEQQILALFDRIRFDDSTRDWFGQVLRARAKDAQKHGLEKRDSLSADLRRAQQQKDRLVNMRLNDEIDADAFARKQGELRERIGEIQLQLEAADREQSEIGELAVKAFELSQSLSGRWVTADIAVKRQILEIVCLNWTLDDVTLVPTIRKPFSVLAEGLVSADNRGTGI